MFLSSAYIARSETRAGLGELDLVICPELCTYCNEELGASTTDVECRDNARKVCWASTGCYRLTFMDKLSATYHIAKVN